MDTIRYLLSFVIKLAFGLLLLALVMWLVGLLYPQFKISNLVSTGVFKRDWLPPPKNFAASFAPKKNGQYGTVYQSGDAYQSNTVYRSTTQLSGGSGTNSANTYPNRLLYVRSLSLYEGNGITFAQRFTGEARDMMFKNGVFSILIIDVNGKQVASTQAINTGVWATPGWARFQATISSRLPPNSPCTLIFQSANEPTQVALPVRCN